MKKIKFVALACCAFLLCVALAGCGASKQDYTGTWDLKYSEAASTDDDATAIAQVYSEEDMTSLREADLDIYLNLDDDGVAVFNVIGTLTTGSWEMNGSNATVSFDEVGTVDPETGETSSVNEAALMLSNGTLKMEKDDTYYYFTKGEDKDPYAAEESAVADEDGMSLIIADGTGKKLDKEVTVADDDIVSIVIDGTGVDSIGDPGYNLRLDNKTSDIINIQLATPTTIDGKEVREYMYVTLNPGMDTITFLPFDYEDLGSSSVDDLKNVKGEFQVDNADTGEVLGTYEFSM